MTLQPSVSHCEIEASTSAKSECDWLMFGSGGVKLSFGDKEAIETNQKLND